MKKKLALCIVAFATMACGGDRRYEIVSAGEDKAFRLDTKTGEVVYIFAIKGVPVEIQKKSKATP